VRLALEPHHRSRSKPSDGNQALATTSPTTTAPSVPPSTATSLAPRPTGIGVVVIDIVDPTRGTLGPGHANTSGRHLPTAVRYPSLGAAGTGEEANAPPAPGPWPLVVFANGYNVSPSTYLHLLDAWTRAGFVVAAPSYPLEAAGGPLNENDLVNEPADTSFVITELLEQSDNGSAPIRGLLDPGRIAAAGHSDGAVAVLGAAFGLRDQRIGPVIAIAGATGPGFPRQDPRHPLLVVQGTSDTTNPPSSSQAVFDQAGSPRFFLTLIGGTHESPVVDDTPWRPVIETVTVDFLQRYLVGPAGGSTLIADGTRPGLTAVAADPG
jgi:predicted dienelactone hydrolase